MFALSQAVESKLNPKEKRRQARERGGRAAGPGLHRVNRDRGMTPLTAVGPWRGKPAHGSDSRSMGKMEPYWVHLGARKVRMVRFSFDFS